MPYGRNRPAVFAHGSHGDLSHRTGQVRHVGPCPANAVGRGEPLTGAAVPQAAMPQRTPEPCRATSPVAPGSSDAFHLPPASRSVEREERRRWELMDGLSRLD